MDNRDMERVGTPVMYEPVGQKPPNSLATVSLVMGIIAVVTSCCFYTVFLFGGLGLIFGLLSRTGGAIYRAGKGRSDSVDRRVCYDSSIVVWIDLVRGQCADGVRGYEYAGFSRYTGIH